MSCLDVTECQACCSPTRNPITCINCGFITCVSCARTYITMVPSENQTWKMPECMSCKKQWDDTFLRLKFPKSFIEGDLKKYMKCLIIEREKGFLQDTVAELERDRDAEKLTELNNILQKLQDYIKTLKKHYKYIQGDLAEVKKLVADAKKRLKNASSTDKATVQSKVFESIAQQQEIETELEATAKKIEKKEQEYQKTQKLYNQHYAIVSANGGNKSKETEQKTTSFIKPCPVNDCKGFLSTKHKCALCDTHCCSECFEIIGKVSPDKSYAELKDEHKCDPNNVESAKALKKECKPCPKCGVPVYKISGCEQIWCVCCHTAFNFSTGKIDTGRIHNPHYNEYLQRNKQAIPAVPLHQQQCLDIDTIQNQVGHKYGSANLHMVRDKNNQKLQNLCKENNITFDQAMQYLDMSYKIYNYVSEIIRLITHCRVYYGNAPEFGPQLTSKIRKQYVKDEITEEQWKTKAMTIYKATEYAHHVANVFDTLRQIAQDVCMQLYNLPSIHFQLRSNYNHAGVHLCTATEDQFKAVLEPYFGFIDYLNNFLKDLSEKYNYTTSAQVDITPGPNCITLHVNTSKAKEKKRNLSKERKGK